MDVILDSNQYLEDVRMQGIKFASLLDYLRKTGSSLVIPRVVRDEVIARYPERLDAQVRKTTTALSSLRSLVFNGPVPRLPELNITEEVEGLRQRLITPRTGVKAIILDSYADVKVAEVVKRGIDRRKPASSTGEQLRDVVLWLMTLNYAKKNKCEVGFITAEEHFLDSDKSDLHPELKREINRRGIRVSFAKSIEEFVKANTPAAKRVSANWVKKYLDSKRLEEVGKIFEQVVRSEVETSWMPGRMIVSATQPILQFKNGRAYKVAPKSEYAELQYEGTVVLDMGEQISFVNTMVGAGPSATISAGQVSAPLQIPSVKYWDIPGYEFPSAYTNVSFSNFAATEKVSSPAGADIPTVTRLLSSRLSCS